MGFPSGTSCKETTFQCGDIRDVGSTPWSGRYPGGGHNNPLQCSCWSIPWAEEPGGLQSIGLQSWTRLKQFSTAQQRGVYVESCPLVSHGPEKPLWSSLLCVMQLTLANVKSTPRWCKGEEHQNYSEVWAHGLQTINAGESVGNREPSFIVGGNVSWYSHYREHYGTSLKHYK